MASIAPLFLDASLFWLAVTLAAYLAGVWLYQRSGGSPLLLPVLTGVILIVAVLMATGTPYARYAEHVRWLSLVIGPATVALAVPLYGQLPRIRQLAGPVLLALLAGSVTAIATAVGIAWLFGGSLQTMLSVAPKSATMPIAIDVAALTGGLPSLASVAVALTGISGVIVAGSICRLLRADDPVTRGFALGLTAHAIGVARGIQEDEATGAFAALGMGLNAIATAVLAPVVLTLMGVF